MQLDAARGKVVQKTPFISEFFAFLDFFRGAQFLPSSVQTDAICTPPDAGRMAPFSAPDGTIVGTIFDAVLSTGWPSVPVDAEQPVVLSCLLAGIGGNASTAAAWSSTPSLV
ncbi:MAG: hypothetical protein AB7O62_11460 [Pirellulales bacterium]